MTHPNLIPNEVYYGTFSDSEIEQEYFIIAQEPGFDYRSNTPWMRPSNEQFGYGSLEPPRFKILRIATAIEKEWMHACKDANTFVAKSIDHLVNQFPIY